MPVELLQASGVPLLASAGDLAPLARDIGVALVLAGVLAVVFHRLRVPSIAAFLVAGVLLGPEAGRVVTDKGNIETIAGLGLTFLLFVIGLEMDVRKLFASGRVLGLAGLLQVPLSVLAGLGLAAVVGALGVSGGDGPNAGLYIGFAVAFSSTLIAAKLFTERFQMDTVAGRISLGMLIFQDVWAIVVLAVQPDLSDPQLGSVGLTVLGIGIVVVVAVLFAKYVLPTAFRWIAKTPELMLVAAVAWCFGVGVFGHHLADLFALAGLPLDVRVSMEMGALIAGASVAFLPYAHEVVSKVGVVRDFFITLFFVGLGMEIPLPRDGSGLAVGALLVGLTVLVRLGVFFPLLYAVGLDRRSSLVISVKLLPISEFCLVIAWLGLSHGHIGPTTVAGTIFAFVVTAVATPFLFDAGDALHARLGPLLSRLGFRAPPERAATDDGEERYEIALLGFHRVASSLLEEIRRRQPDLLRRILVVDYNVGLHPQIRALGPTVRYGDIANPESLRSAGVDRARVVVSTVHDDILKGTSNRRLVEIVRDLQPEATIVANAVDLPSARDMLAAGADHVFLYRLDAARGLLPALEAALQGTLPAWRAAREGAEGSLADRSEVLP